MQSVAYIESLAPTLLNPSLDRMSAFMAQAGKIQDTFSTIHVGGTNGKGSTVAILDSVLRRSGLKVGRFTGPHLLRWNERFHVNGQAISDEGLAELASRVRNLSEEFGKNNPELGSLTWFEYLTAIGFYFFAEENVDVAVIEVGLGGRWDATNVISKPLVSVITTVDLDHTHILGATVEEISREKGGIVKSGVSVVTGVTGAALPVLQETARARATRLITCVPPDAVHDLPAFDRAAFRQCLPKLALCGQYQVLNALLAAAALTSARDSARLAMVTAESIEQGFASVYWPGRFQYLRDRHLVLDGAHNPSGARALRQSLDDAFGTAARTYVLSFFQNKNVPEMLAALLRPGDVVYAAEAATTRATFSVREIVERAQAHGCVATECANIGAAFRAGESDSRLVVATGSFATVKESMLAMGWQSVEDGLAATSLPESRRLMRD